MLTLDKIYHASKVLKDVIHPTTIVRASAIDADCDLYLKPECLQLTGSFKLRGSGYKISQLTDEEKERGVIACSAGNHAQGVALAATKYGIKSLICLPDGAPISKVEATKAFGAEVCMVPGVYDDAYAEACRLRDEHNYTFIHPFDDENVIAGQGTIGLEIMNEMNDVDAVICAVGERVKADLYEEAGAESDSDSEESGDVTEYNWEDVESMDGADEMLSYGKFITLDEINCKVWVPVKAMQEVSLSDEEKEDGSVACFVTEDEEDAFRIQYVDASGMTLEKYKDILENMDGASEVEDVIINGVQGVAYVVKDQDSCHVAFTTDYGYILEFSWAPASNEDYAALIAIMMSSIQEA